MTTQITINLPLNRCLIEAVLTMDLNGRRGKITNITVNRFIIGEDDLEKTTSVLKNRFLNKEVEYDFDNGIIWEK